VEGDYSASNQVLLDVSSKKKTTLVLWLYAHNEVITISVNI
jgi:hypothetical protein